MINYLACVISSCLLQSSVVLKKDGKIKVFTSEHNFAHSLDPALLKQESLL